MERIAKERLLEFLESFDAELGRRITIVAVGGTAMTLLGLKASTKDIDFNIPSEADFKEFMRVRKKIKPGVKIDCWPSNMIFSEVLPTDYVKMATEYDSEFSKIRIKLLNPVDIACSKISRFNEADKEDIKDCIRIFGITKTQISSRARGYSRTGNDDVFNHNLEDILLNMF